jgi:hypothetical protein
LPAKILRGRPLDSDFAGHLAQKSRSLDVVTMGADCGSLSWPE